MCLVVGGPVVVLVGAGAMVYISPYGDLSGASMGLIDLCIMYKSLLPEGSGIYLYSPKDEQLKTVHYL